MNINENQSQSPSEDVPSKLPLVMLIDDSEIDNYVNNKIIRRYGFSDRILTHEASSTAFEYLLNAVNNGDEIPSVIFLDLNIPVMDGRMFIEKFEGFAPHIREKCKIIILSNSADPNVQAELLGKGTVYAFFSKPLIKDNLDHVSLILSTNEQLRPAHKNHHADKTEVYKMVTPLVTHPKNAWLSFLNKLVPSLNNSIVK